MIMLFANFRTQAKGKWKTSNWWTQIEIQNDLTINWNNEKILNALSCGCHLHSQLKPIKWIINKQTKEFQSIYATKNDARKLLTLNWTAIDTNEINIWLLNEPQLINHINYFWKIFRTTKGVKLRPQLIHNSFLVF